MIRQCPNCETEIYNRAQRLCRACGSPVPAQFLLSEPEIRRFEESVEERRNSNCAAEAAMPEIPLGGS